MSLSIEEIHAFGSSKTPEWETPPEIFEPLNKEFNFTLDVCANERNHKCTTWYGKFHEGFIDGLRTQWYGRCWMNPPYGREIKEWVKKAYEETQNGHADLVVALLPARTDTAWFHDWVYGKAELRFLRKRVKFIDASGKQDHAGLFGSMVAIYRGDSK